MVLFLGSVSLGSYYDHEGILIPNTYILTLLIWRYNGNAILINYKCFIGYILFKQLKFIGILIAYRMLVESTP